MSDLSQEKKEKQQKIILAAIFTAAGLFVLWSFMLKPNIIKSAKLKKDIAAELEIEAENTKLLANKPKYYENKLVAMKLLNKLINKKMPPTLGSETWLAKNFNTIALEANLNEKSISVKTQKITNCPGSHYIAKKLKKGEKRKTKQALLIRIPVVVSMKCTYHELGNYLKILEKKMPYCEISNLTITKEMKRIDQKELSIRDKRILDVSINIRIPRFNEHVITTIPTKEAIIDLEKEVLKYSIKKEKQKGDDNNSNNHPKKAKIKEVENA